MPADSFCPPSYLYARHSLLTFILFMCPPFCLHARRFVLPVIFSTPVILFTHPLTHFSRQTKYAHGFVYMPAESSISARRLVYMPAILIYASSCLCARGSVYTHLVYMPAARLFVYTPARACHLLYTPSIRHLVYVPAVLSTRVLFTCPRFCPHASCLHAPLIHFARHFVYMPAVLSTRLPVPIIFSTRPPLRSICHLVYIPAVLSTRPRIHSARLVYMLPILFTCPRILSARHAVHPHCFIYMPTMLLHARHFVLPAILSFPLHAHQFSCLSLIRLDMPAV